MYRRSHGDVNGDINRGMDYEEDTQLKMGSQD